MPGMMPPDDADGGGHTGDSHGELSGVALFHHLRHKHAGHAGGVGHGGAGDAGKDHGRKDVHMGQAAVDVTHNGITKVHQVFGDAALGHGVAGEGVEGHGQQGPAVHALKGSLGHSDDAAAVQEQNAAHGGQAKGDADGHTQDHQNNKAA